MKTLSRYNYGTDRQIDSGSKDLRHSRNGICPRDRQSDIIMSVTAEQTGASAHAGFGEDGKPYFWLMARGRPVVHGVHVAFAAADHDAVDTFHAAGLVAGGTDNGAPGPRPIYHSSYYGAFVLDPDGNNVEAVCHAPVD